MPVQKDYILKMFEMLADSIAKIMGLTDNDDFNTADDLIDEAYSTFTKKDKYYFYNLTENKIAEILTKEDGFTTDQLIMIADILYADAQIKEKQGNADECKNLYKKTLTLLQFIDKELKTYDFTRISKIEDITQKI